MGKRCRSECKITRVLVTWFLVRFQELVPVNLPSLWCLRYSTSISITSPSPAIKDQLTLWNSNFVSLILWRQTVGWKLQEEIRFDALCEHLFCIKKPGSPVAQVPFFGPISCGRKGRITYVRHEITCLKGHLVQLMVSYAYYLFLSKGHGHGKCSKQDKVLFSVCRNSKCRI